MPFIASFCSHVNDQTYEKKHGLLSQWRGYGKGGGFCIVFDTTAFVTILEAEFNAYNWTLLRIAPVHYAYDDIEVDNLFPELVERCEAFLSRPLDNKHPLVDEAGLAPFFMSACPLFKHQCFREEREVRIVAIPGAREVLRSFVAQHPEYDVSERVMRRHGLRARAPRRYRVSTTDSKHSLPVAANLLDQNFIADPAQSSLVGRYHLHSDQRWLYLAVILDLFTRKVVGWAMRDHMRAEYSPSLRSPWQSNGSAREQA